MGHSSPRGITCTLRWWSRPCRRWPTGRLAAVLAVVVAACCAALAGPVGLQAAGAAISPTGEVTIDGHGWGGGVGMGQWGALGYAIGQDGGAGNFTYQQILQHYYAPATLESDTNLAIGSGNDSQSVTVAMLEANDQYLIATASGGVTVPAGGTAPAVMIQPSQAPGGPWSVYTASSCAGPWTPSGTTSTPTVSATTSGSPITMCYVAGGSGATTTVQGSLTTLLNSNNAERTINTLPLGEYLDGVVPSESPSYWGGLGGSNPQLVGGQAEDWGFQELEAQAVAARSYVLAGGTDAYGGYADICDTTACQDYTGTAYENNPYTDLAVSATAGLVMEFANGNVADTQYSASTGGYTAGGQFTAVPDDGDGVCISGACNPSHDWSAQVPVATIEAEWPQLGTLQSLSVTSRNGDGDYGGRVATIEVVGSAGSVTVSGYTFATDFGLKSDWFEVVGASSGGIGGYWLGAADGGIFSFGNAQFQGSMGGKPLNQPIVGLAVDPATGGYWEVAADGGIFSFGAPFYGSMGGKPLNQPIVGMAATSDGGGYWLVASDGGIFAFGDAQFHGSTGGMSLVQPVVGMAATSDGGGYWLVAADGGVFNFGDATFEGSASGTPAGPGTVAIVGTATSKGYLLVNGSGVVTGFGDAPSLGDLATVLSSYGGYIVGMVATAG